MYKYIFGMVAGMTIVPLFYLAESRRGFGLVASLSPLLFATAIVAITWFFAFKVVPGLKSTDKSRSSISTRN